MQIRFDAFWIKNLGTLYKDNSIDILGREFTVDLDLKEVKAILVEFKSDIKSFTDLVEIVDVERRLVRVPFKGDATRYEGVTSFELVAIMKNGETKPSQTYAYSVARSLQNPNCVESDSNYPILARLIENVDEKVGIVDDAIANIDNNINEMQRTIDASLEEKSNIISTDMNEKFETYRENSENNLNDKFESYSDTINKNISDTLNKKIEDVNDAISSIPSREELKGDKGDKGDIPSIEHLERAIEDKISEIEESYNNLEKIMIDENASANLQNQINSVNSQLEQKANKGDSITVHHIDKNKGKIDQTYLSEELIKQIAGNASINAIPADNSITNNKLASNSLSFSKFESFKLDDRYNLWDKNNLNPNGYYDKSGNWANSVPGYGSTGFIPIDHTKLYKQNFGGHITFWDSSFNFICAGEANSNGVVTIPNNDRIAYFNSATPVNGSSDKYIVLLEHEANKNYTKFSSPNLLIKDENLDKDNLKITSSNVDFISIERTKNLFNVENMNTDGFYNPSNGNWSSLTGYGSSELIEVEEGEYYSIWKTSGYVTFFDENKKFCGGLKSGWDGLVPEGVKYISWVVLLSNKDTEVIWKNKEKPTVYIPYYKYILDKKINLPSKVNSELNGLTWNVMGDSISSTVYASGRPYWYHLAQEYGMQIRNYAISGAWISKGGNQTISEAWETMNDEADIITVFAGTNDNLNTNPLGTMEDRTNTTFYGALHVLYSGLINKYPGKKIGIISIMLRSGYRAGDNSTWDRKNNAILEVAKYYNLPVFKAHEEFNLNANIPLIKEKFIEDGLHPNEDGQKIMARRLKKWLESL